MDQPSSNPTLAAAYEYARHGWRVIPVHTVNADGTCACGITDVRRDKVDGVEVGEPYDHHAAGKHPIGMRWQERASTAGPDIFEWFATNPPNIGIATGEASGIFVLDVDPDAGGYDTLRELEDDHGRLYPTLVVETGSGGEHHYFAWPGFDVSNSAGQLGPGLDIRGNGGQVVAPPSVSARGGYRVVNEEPVGPAPEWLLNLIRRPEARSVDVVRHEDVPEGYVSTVLERELADLAAVEPGGRNHALNRAAFAVSTMIPHGVISAETVRDAFIPVALDLGLDAREAEKTIASAIKGGCEKPRPWPPEDRRTPAFIPFDDAADGSAEAWPVRTWDDFGNAARLLDHYPDRLKWVDMAEKWAVYEGTRWQLDATRTAQRFAQETLHSLPSTEAYSYPDDNGVQPDDKGKGGEPSSREKFVTWAKSQRFAGKVRAMLEVARGIGGLAAEITDFDADPMLLNARNGVLNLDTGELLAHDARLMQMQQVNAAYDPAARCPRWEAFLAKMQPNADVRAYLQRVIGYSLTGDISEQKLFMHLGEGANGKSVMLEVMTALAGSYAQAIPRTTLIETRHEGIPNDVARMAGKRFLQTSETGKGKVLDEEAVKGLTGGEEQSARFMRAEFFDFKPTGKIHYVTNHFPKVSDAPSLWRRLVVIKWTVTIADDDPERDRHLGQKIVAEELDGVLAWAVEGLRQWKAQGLAEPVLVKAWSGEYREDADEFGDFVDEVLQRDGAFGFCPVQSLYDAYAAWVGRGGRGQPMSMKAFATALRERGLESARARLDGRRVRGFIGVRVRPDLGIAFDVTRVEVEPIDPRDPDVEPDL